MQLKHFAFLGMLGLLNTNALEAKVVQILHTNDTHSFLDHATHKAHVGGMARIKTMIDKLKLEAEKKDIPTLVFDAGDFLEGNIYYMADGGMKSFEVHNKVGYDVVALGNHDYLMGAEELDRMLGKLDLNFSLLAANVKAGKQYKNIHAKLKPYQEFDLDGIKLGVIGLTTNEVYYTWRLENSKVKDPYDTAKKYEKILKEKDNDFVFAVTHMGVNKDKKLASKTKQIDLIVGGHSHTVMSHVHYEKNAKGKQVPIVQAGDHTNYMGKMLVDLEKGKPLKVLSYELVPIIDVEEDREVKELILEADRDLEALYGAEWLKRKIGYSDLKLTDNEGEKKWAFYIADTIREKIKADFSIHAPPMNGSNFPVGNVTNRSILDSFPRVFEVDRTEGWTIYTARIQGALLWPFFKAMAAMGEPLAYSGIDVDYKRMGEEINVSKIRYKGKRINPFKLYTVAFTEGIIRGAVEISPATKIILRKPRDTGHYVWQTLIDQVEHEGVSTKVINGKKVERSYFRPEDFE